MTAAWFRFIEIREFYSTDTTSAGYIYFQPGTVLTVLDEFIASYAGYSTLAGAGASSLTAAGMMPQRVMGHNQ